MTRDWRDLALPVAMYAFVALVLVPVVLPFVL